MQSRKPFAAWMAGASAVALLAASAAAQDDTAIDTAADDLDDRERIVVTGTRVEGRSPTETTSPIDLYTADNLVEQGGFDFTDQLRTISPSFNTQRYPIADGTSFIRPANLRNLAPDQTLVLVNGSRRHKSALVNLQVEPFGTVNQGAQAVDFGIIPSNAVERVEILRDGASAQYGSDAIAGVINVILKDDSEGLTGTARYGEFYDSDGENLTLGANLGLPLGDIGFLNLSGEYVSSGITSRGSARPDAAAVADAVGAENVPFNGLGQRWGDPDIEGVRLFANAGIDVSADLNLFGHMSYADQDVVSGFFYRAPVGVPGVDPRATLFVDNDLNGDPDPVDQDIIDAILDAGLDPADYVTADAGSPSGYVALNPIAAMFPGGYNPTFGAQLEDFAAVGGAQGELANGLSWSLAGRYGQNDVTYTLENSINPGLGITSPISFKPGKLQQREVGVNLDFVYPLAMDGLASPLNVAFGAEWRNDYYEIGIGDPKSFEFGPTGILFGIGSDGFQGDSPAAAGTFERGSIAGYLDLEADVTERLTLGAAIRAESYDDFGETFDWKLAGRYQAADWLAVRGTVSTGFRAPTPGQVNTLDVTTTSDSDGNLVPLGTFPVNSAAAMALGAQPLDPEESTNYTIGAVVTPNANWSFTVDAYQIEVTDRIALASIEVAPGSPEQQALIDAGVEGAELLGTVSFFTNGFDTTVRGIDVAATTNVDFGDKGDLVVDLRHAWNEQEVDSVRAASIGPERVFDLENQLPNHRTVLTLDYQTPWKVDAMMRLNYYGEWEDSTFGEFASFGASTLVDAEVEWHVNDNVSLAVGGQNIFDEYPDDETNSTLRFLGATRPVSSPYGFNGGFWYARATLRY